MWIRQIVRSTVNPQGDKDVVARQEARKPGAGANSPGVSGATLSAARNYAAPRHGEQADDRFIPVESYLVTGRHLTPGKCRR
jgi:hypothetical protein